ncbi:MAG: peptidylprolyl isomerase, partial [Planctomycetaceae bacterium]|nr:peptidylprolyl isomerase [Planctomycetaceae bacterium]
YSITVTLKRFDLDTSTTADDQLSGLQTIRVRATDEASNVQDASISVDYAVGSVVQFVSTNGTYEVELFDVLTPNTVANFKSYLTDYSNSVIHRSVSSFVIQGGGYTLQNGVFEEVPEQTPITNEFNSATSNIRGTLSMALLGGQPDSGNSEWFINTVDNVPSLNTAGHTVFGRVIGQGMTVVDAINALSKFDLTDATNISALGEIPRQTTFVPLNTPLTGTVAVTSGSTTLTGTGTLFTQELTPRLLSPTDNPATRPARSYSRISINGQLFTVEQIISDTELELSSTAAADASGVLATTDQFVDDDFVKFSSISEILDTI